jgi:hypothetical protein
MVKRAVEMEGTVTGEHGVGMIKRDYLNHELGDSTVDAMRKVSAVKFINFLALTVLLVKASFRSPLSFELRQDSQGGACQTWRDQAMVINSIGSQACLDSCRVYPEATEISV